MINFSIYNKVAKPTAQQKEEIVAFLYKHLEEYGDKRNDILKCLNYAIEDLDHSFGGFVLIIKENTKILGATIINETGMGGYIPENILVYIAVHNNARGKGVGKKLMQKAIEITNGDIALHVEPNNPAKHLYEKLGFENKYLEMRLKK
ncbi:MAG: GNAT family N-acetyltransferase [Lutibacter sp.]|uniref:GNAT family N-acetyltransferase n=1 Tax=Lutibacter sp. TaxID=1925666 RepID=UPI0017914D8D|nr:GNAT family N-acetyltransferase [Lutibacter sp.]MBT8317458.1 GNAT family N-acetyltransferase [Lutibacter sp.]NNJ58317.1 GNAT family N-acetyltransferase [Lutibacter sp.]